MPKTLYSDNYYYELYQFYMIVYKYDIFDKIYIKVDQCLLSKLPNKYVPILSQFNDKLDDLQSAFTNIKISV